MDTSPPSACVNSPNMLSCGFQRLGGRAKEWQVNSPLPLRFSHTPFTELSWSPGGRVVFSSLTQADLQQKENINWGKSHQQHHAQTTGETLSCAGRGLRVSPWWHLFMCEVSFYASTPDAEDIDELQRTKRG